MVILYESGCRIGELLGLRIKHIKHVQPGIQIMVDGKTGPRRIRLISSEPHLTEWINKHPEAKNLEAPLWLSRNVRTLGYTTVHTLLNRLSKKAKIIKKINPHLFRHSRATFLENHLTESQMKEYLGWVQASKMAGIYVHLSGRDVDGAILKLHGIEPETRKKDRGILKPRNCPRCDLNNPSTNSYCSQCGMPLDEKSMIKLVERDMQRKRADEKLDELVQEPEFREIFLRKIEKLKG